jgi:hypothetical protein
VPYDLIGETVDVRVSKNTVEVFYHGTRVAVHVRPASRMRDPIVKPEHMPEAHRKYLHYNAEEFKTWAASVGPNTEKVVNHFLTEGFESGRLDPPGAAGFRISSRRPQLATSCKQRGGHFSYNFHRPILLPSQ